MRFVDRLLTIVVTATATSAAWIVFGGELLRQAPVVERTAAMPAALTAPSVNKAARTGQTPPQVAKPVTAGRLLIPVANVPSSALTDTYTQSRAGGTRLHEAIDIMAPRGTPVIAAAAGVVEKLFLSEDGGKTIYIRLPDRRTITYYSHLDSYAADLREGASVRQGQVLGTVGSTGNASPEAPHLHFAVMRTTPDREWYEPAEAINPYPLLTGR